MRHVDSPNRSTGRRAVETVLDVLPRSVKVREAKRDSGTGLIVGNQPLEIKWVGEGNLGDVRPVLASRRGRPDVVVGRRLSPGAREALSAAGVGWVDETGAAEIAVGSIIVSRTGHPPKSTERPRRWTPAVIAVAEALLCGAKGTVAATEAATGLSTGSCTNALRTLTDLGLLEAKSGRGRESARQLVDPEGLLGAYALAVEASPDPISVQVGVTWRDPVAGLVTTGRKWDKAKVVWAATGVAAASVIAPYLTTVTSTEVYVDADTIVGLEAIAADAGLRPIEGGRLTLRPFPTVAVRRLAETLDGLRVAPWPRVYVDLRRSGVRGEEAAEHLREVIHAR
jgi:hypothetical protein